VDSACIVCHQIDAVGMTRPGMMGVNERAHMLAPPSAKRTVVGSSTPAGASTGT
jgi:hypothetical protein